MPATVTLAGGLTIGVTGTAQADVVPTPQRWSFLKTSFLGPARQLTVVRLRGRSRSTGKAVAMDLHHFFRFRDGKIAYYRGTEDTAETEAAVRN